MRWILCLLALAACGPRQPATADPGTLVGTVVSVDAEPMTYDGDARVVVRTDGGETVTVLIPARTNLCEADLASLEDLLQGTRVRVRGTVNMEGDVTPCTEREHYLRIDS